jgi:WD40 repeat protein
MFWIIFRFVSSRGPDVEIYSIENANVEMTLQTFHAGVRTFAINDESSLICIVDDSSSVLFYSLNISIGIGKSFIGNNLESKLKSITSTSLVRECFTAGFKVSWLPHKEMLAAAVPSTKGSIIIFNRKGGKSEQKKDDHTPEWEEIYIVNSETSQLTHGSEDISLAVFSPNGQYLATADNVGIVVIWEISSSDLFSMTLTSGSFVPINMLKTVPKGPLFDLVWGQKDGDNYLMLASASSSGYNCFDIHIYIYVYIYIYTLLHGPHS